MLEFANPKARPSAVLAGVDKVRPGLLRARVECHDKEWFLVCSDSYMAVAVTLRLCELPDRTEIPVGALKLIERGKPFTWDDGFTFHGEGFERVTYRLDSKDAGAFPELGKIGLFDKPADWDTPVDDIGFNGEFAARVSKALGSNHLRFRFKTALRPIHVSSLKEGGHAILMPVRVNV